MMRSVSSPVLLKKPALLDPVLQCEGWHTLMTFTREHARTSYPYPFTSSDAHPLLQHPPDHEQTHLPVQVRMPWTRTSLPRCTTRSPRPKLSPAAVSGYAPTAHLRTRMEGRIARFVGCRCRGASGSLFPIQLVYACTVMDSPSDRSVPQPYLAQMYPQPFTAQSTQHRPEVKFVTVVFMSLSTE